MQWPQLKKSIMCNRTEIQKQEKNIYFKKFHLKKLSRLCKL